MKTIKTYHIRNGIKTEKSFELSEEQYESFMNKIKDMRLKKRELQERMSKKITPELIEKLKNMNTTPESPG